MNILFEIADKDLIFIGLALFAVILFAVIIFYVVNKNNRIQPISDEERFDLDTSEEIKIEEVKPVTEEQQQAKAELERVFNQMSADLETKQPSPEVIEEFEREQEESAIISYQELIRQAEAKKALEVKPKVEETRTKEDVLADYFNEPISQSLEIRQPEKVIKQEEKKPEEPRKFKNSDIISPIFGIQSSENYYKTEEPTTTPKHAYEEIKNAYECEENTEFLNSLKEFRRNL